MPEIESCCKMGAANSTVRNKTHAIITVKTYNWADAVCWIPFDSYDIGPGEETMVYAAANACGLKYQIESGGRHGDILGGSNGQIIEVFKLP